MAEGWRQTWEDILNTLRGEPEPKAERPPEGAVPGIEGQTAEALADSGETVSEGETLDLQSSSAEGTPPVPLPQPENALGEFEAVVNPVDTLAPVPASTPRRRILDGAVYLILIGALIAGLWLSGGSRLWARWTAPKPPAPDVIATYTGGQLTTADVETHLKLLVPEDVDAAMRSPQLFLEVVEEMLMDELARQWAANRQPDTDENFSHTMQHINEELNLQSLDLQLHESDIPVAESEIQAYYRANQSQFGDQPLDVVREQIRQTLVSEREGNYITDYIQRLKDNGSITRNFDLLDVPAPSEDDLRRYYDKNLEQFKLPRQALVDEIQVPVGSEEAVAQRTADDALLKVRSGASFAEVGQAITQTLVTTSTLVAEGSRDPAWDAAAFALTEGELSDVFRAGEAFSIIRMNELQPARTQSLDEVRSTVLSAVQQQKTEEWFDLNGGKTLFTLKGKQYTVGQFYQEYKELPVFTQTEFSGPEGMKKLAEQLIERLLLVEDSYDQLLEVQNKPLADEARLQVVKQMLHQEEIDDQIQVTEEEMQKYYDENSSLMALPPQARIRYIRIGMGASEDEQKAAQQRADEAYRKLAPGLFQKGADFAAVAKEYSEDPETAAQGGEFPGWVGESEDILAELQIHPFHEAVLALEPDEISQPFTYGDSLYIVQVVERTGSQILAFEDAKPYIQEILNQQKHEELLRQLTEKLFSQANVVVYEDVLRDYFEKLAQEAATPAP